MGEWIDQDIKCFNIGGSLFQAIKTKPGLWPHDIAVESSENILYIDQTTRTVNKVKNKQTKELIRLQEWSPVNLCVTSTEDILVSMYSESKTRFQTKVVRFSGYTEKQRFNLIVRVNLCTQRQTQLNISLRTETTTSV